MKQFLSHTCTYKLILIYIYIWGAVYNLRGFEQCTQSCTDPLLLLCINSTSVFNSYSPVSWDGRIYWLHLCRGVRPLSPNEYPGYDIKQSGGDAPVMLELWGMRSTLSLPLFPDPLWPRVVAPERVLSMHQIELFDI